MTANHNSFVDRAIATITEAAGPHRDEWSPYDHDVVNQARDADAQIERLRAELAHKDAYYAQFNLTPKPHCGRCDDTGSMSDGTACPHLSGEPESQPVIAKHKCECGKSFITIEVFDHHQECCPTHNRTKGDAP